MNEQILSFIRTLFQSGASALAAKGIIDQESQTVLVTFVMWLIPTGWGLYERRRNGLIASAAAVLPPGGKIETPPEIAAAVPDPKVVAR